MLLIEWLAIVALSILLGASLYMIITFYTCDSGECKAFKQAKEKATPGTKEFALALLNEFYNDGIWPIPFISAMILTPIALWFLELPIDVRNFSILLFVSFVITYFAFSFLGHHYIQYINNYIYNYIDNVCLNNNDVEQAVDQ